MSHEIVVHQTYKEEGQKGPKRLYINVNGKLINNHIHLLISLIKSEAINVLWFLFKIFLAQFV